MEMRVLHTSSSTPLTGDAIIRDLKSNGFPDATTRPTDWQSGQGQCLIFRDTTAHYIDLDDTADDTNGRAITITAYDDLASDALQVVVETVKSEVAATEILGF